MKTAFRNQFLRDLRVIRDKQLLALVKEVIEVVEKAGALTSLQNLKPIKGAKSYYRIRIGEYRLGLSLDGDTVTFARLLHRREIYRYFP